MQVLTFLSTLLPLYLAQGPTATATFGSAANNDAAIGTVTVQDGVLTVDLNLTYGKMDSTFDDACLQGGFTYHIHTEWNNPGTWGTYLNCSAAKTAYHYDPYAACGANTGNLLCVPRSGCITAGSGSGTYSCSSANFDMNPLYCEVGDWSGKYGTLYANNAGNTSFGGTWSSFFEADADLLSGQSVVFHCNGERALCAEFVVSGVIGTDDKPDQPDMKTIEVDFSDAIASYDTDYVEEILQYLTASSDGTFELKLNFSDVATTNLRDDYSSCASTGLYYYIFSEWNSIKDSIWGDSCAYITGGYTWDPTNQCLPMSNSNDCTDNVACSGNANSKIYDCDSSTDYSCAPGDLSGKWGVLPVSTEPIVIEISGTDDELPNLDNIIGASVGILCGSTWVMCGRIQDKSEAIATATFSSGYTNITGTVTVTNQEIVLDLDTSKQVLESSCTTGGLSWHIHNEWTYTDQIARHGSTACGGTYTGGHYDPYNGCGSATDNSWCFSKIASAMSTACDAVGTYTNSSTFNPTAMNSYTCSESYFTDYPYTCEVGDWSGKYGKAVISGNTITGTYTSQFAEVRASDLYGKSIVFHCNGGSRIFCAPFEVVGTDGNDLLPDNVSSRGNKWLIAYFQDITGAGDMYSNYVKIYENNKYEVVLNTSNIANQCITATNYKLSLYNNWYGFTTQNDQVTGSTCATRHDTFYDPGYTCPPQINNTNCDCIKNNGYSYSCNYDTDKFSCAVGDLSGKYGYIYPLNTFYATGYDFTLPSIDDINDLAIVLECNEVGYTPIGCTGFTSMTRDPTTSPTDVTPEPTGLPTGSPTDDKDNDAYKIISNFTMVFITLFFTVFVC